MNQHSDIRSLFLAWAEEKIDQKLTQEVEDHLKGCSSCRQYFDAMTAALLPGESPKSRLVADPYMPARIRALANDAASFSPSVKDLIIRWSLRTVVFAAAIVAGIYMGEKLSYERSVVTEQYIISEYSGYLGESGIGERWQSVALTSEVVPK